MPRDAARTAGIEKDLAAPGLSDLMRSFEDQLESIHTGNETNIKLCVTSLYTSSHSLSWALTYPFPRNP
jgi:hypothetical protein